MKTIEPNEKINVEEVIRQLLERKITIQRFKLPCTQEQATDLLAAAYRSEVAFRGRNYIHDSRLNQHIVSLAKFMTDCGSKFGVLLCGTYGNGKTTLLYALRSVVSMLADGGYLDGHTAIKIYDAWHIAKLYRDRDPKVFEDVCKERLLAIEDLGKEPTESLDYGNVISPVVELLEQRYMSQRFTAITTNLTPKEIREKYGNRIADRCNEMMCVINFGAAKTFRI